MLANAQITEEQLRKETVEKFLHWVSCPCAGGRGRRNDNKDNHVVSGLVVYQGVMQ